MPQSSDLKGILAASQGSSLVTPCTIPWVQDLCLTSVQMFQAGTQFGGGGACMARRLTHMSTNSVIIDRLAKLCRSAYHACVPLFHETNTLICTHYYLSQGVDDDSRAVVAFRMDSHCFGLAFLLSPLQGIIERGALPDISTCVFLRR